ncbi:aminoglycoside O-phosphotransferase APH(9)-Ia [soil metagenome]
MLVKLPLSDQQIIDRLKINYALEILKLTFLPLGADMNASVYKAETQGQSSYFIKLKRGCHSDINTVILELLHSAGIPRIIYPIKTNNGQLTQYTDGFTLIVYQFIEGQNGFNRILTDEQWLILGKTLRQVHEIDMPITIQQRIKREAYSSKWRKVVRSLYTHIEAGLGEGDEVSLKLLAFMKKNKSIIYQLVERSEELGQKLLSESPEFVLCHSDIHAGNILIDENNAIYIVDWDEPILAPKERDLMFIGGGVGNVWNKPHEEALFYKGYGKTEINMKNLAYYRHERIVEDIALFGQDLLLKTTGGEDRPEMYRHFLAMFVPNGVIEIAFRTNEYSSFNR